MPISRTQLEIYSQNNFALCIWQNEDQKLTRRPPYLLFKWPEKWKMQAWAFSIQDWWGTRCHWTGSTEWQSGLRIEGTPHPGLRLFCDILTHGMNIKLINSELDRPWIQMWESIIRKNATVRWNIGGLNGLKTPNAKDRRRHLFQPTTAEEIDKMIFWYHP